MNNLVGKVRGTVRGRSKTRNEQESTLKTTQRPAQLDLTTPRDLNANGTPRVSSPTSPSWHVHKGVRNSSDTHPPITSNLPPLDSPADLSHDEAVPHPNTVSQSQSQVPYSYQTAPNNASEKIPKRYSSLKNQQSESERPLSGDYSQGGVPYPYTVPRRKDSLPQNRPPRKISPNQRKGEPQKSLDLEQAHQQMREVSHHPKDVDHNHDANQLPLVQPADKGLGMEIDHGLANLSVHDKEVATGSEMKPLGGATQEALEHLRVPEGFKLGQTAKTSIDTEWKPAVTHENVYYEKTEIVQEAITRDIHIHHYYTYVQPIKVVEILPAKHYTIDEATGIKVEIPTPEGWEMPQDLRPYTPNLKGVTGWTRHYLVNEQHPYGVEEQAPRDQSGNAYTSRRRAEQTVL